eukprot:3588656-Amphidinium_carterae.1
MSEGHVCDQHALRPEKFLIIRFTAWLKVAPRRSRKRSRSTPHERRVRRKPNMLTYPTGLQKESRAKVPPNRITGPRILPPPPPQSSKTE